MSYLTNLFRQQIPQMFGDSQQQIQQPQYSARQQPQLSAGYPSVAPQNRLAHLAGTGMQQPQYSAYQQPQLSAAYKNRAQPRGPQRAPTYQSTAPSTNQFAPSMPTGPQISQSGYYNPNLAPAAEARNQFAPSIGIQQGNLLDQEGRTDEWQQRRNQFIPRNRYWED